MGIFDIDYYAPYIRYDTVFGGKHHEWKRINPALYKVQIKGDFSKVEMKEETNMETLTKEEAIRKHRALWAYMAAQLKVGNNITKVKALNELFPEEDIMYNNCYLCEYSVKKQLNGDGGYEDTCKYCPLCNECTHGTNCLSGKYAAFNTARHDKDYARASEIAFEIATLPAVDRKSYADKVLEKVKNIYEEEKGLLARTFDVYDSSDYIWVLGYGVINALESKCDYKINAVTQTTELFGIEVTEDKARPETIRLYKVKQSGYNK